MIKTLKSWLIRKLGGFDGHRDPFKFRLHDRVLIIPLKQKGTVVSRTEYTYATSKNLTDFLYEVNHVEGVHKFDENQLEIFND